MSEIYKVEPCQGRRPLDSKEILKITCTHSPISIRPKAERNTKATLDKFTYDRTKLLGESFRIVWGHAQEPIDCGAGLWLAIWSANLRSGSLSRKGQFQEGKNAPVWVQVILGISLESNGLLRSTTRPGLDRNHAVWRPAAVYPPRGTGSSLTPKISWLWKKNLAIWEWWQGVKYI